MDQHGQTAQKLKPVKNVQNCSKMIFCKLKAKKNVLQQKLHPKFSRNASNYSNFARKQAIGQTTQKPKIGQKVENTETKLCQNTANHSNLAHKRPKRSNRTKNETRVNTSKTATKC